ncbi:unnamed protein product [Alternaria alternata]
MKRTGLQGGTSGIVSATGRSMKAVERSYTMIQRATIIEGDRHKLSACGRGDFRRQKQFYLRRHLLL